MRHAHYWKLAGAKCAPCEIVCVDTETWHGDRATAVGGEWHTLRLGCALAYRLEKGKRTRIKRIVFTTPQPFWELVMSRLNKRRPVWVFAHNAAYDLGVLDGWKFITGSDVEVEKAAVSGQILFIKCLIKGCGLVFCDTLNYYRCSLEAMGRAVGIHKGTMPDQSSPDSDWVAYCKQDVEVTAAGVDALIDFTRKECLGPWQPSIAGLSFSGFRARFMRDKILVHDRRDILELERNCYYGGVVDTPRIGEVRDVWELDVCSMYPAVCRNPVPIYLKGDTGRIGVEGIKRLSQTYMVCADVTVETEDYPYPVRRKTGTYYPHGRYRTCLAHPELMHAIGKGHVKWVHHAAWYRHAPIFREYMEHFIGMKSEYRKQNPPNEAFATICKYYGNGLYGKTGQLSPKWRQWDADSLQTIETRYGLAPGTLEDHYQNPPDLYQLEETIRLPGVPDSLEVRDYYGCVEVKCGEDESRDSCPIIAATVTSYARLLLRGYQHTAGSGNWYYSDTDSIWVSHRGKANLEAAGVVADETLGYLSVKKHYDWLRVFGPKDYETENVRRLKGIRPRAKPDGNGGWVQLHFPSAARQIKTGKCGGVFVASVTKHLSRTLSKCVLLPDGRTRPLVFPMEDPETIVRKGKKS